MLFAAGHLLNPLVEGKDGGYVQLAKVARRKTKLTASIGAPDEDRLASCCLQLSFILICLMQLALICFSLSIEVVWVLFTLQVDGLVGRSLSDALNLYECWVRLNQPNSAIAGALPCKVLLIVQVTSTQ